jgi:ParB-like chromosome segregation protein Spo0J
MPTQSNATPDPRRNRPVWISQKIDQTPISDLNPFPNNVRTHSEKSLARLADSIAEFGFVVPVVIDSENNVITGHGRIEAAKRLKLATIPTIRADHLTAAQVKAYRIADNRLAELSNWPCQKDLS